MAKSGSFSTSAYSFKNGDRYLTFEWSITSQSIANKTTTISWQLIGDGSYPYNPVVSDIYVEIDGVVVYDQPSSYHVNIEAGDVVASGTKTFAHNADGTRQFTAYAEAGIYRHDANCFGTGTFTLDDIPGPSTLVAYNGTLGVEHTLTIGREADSLKHRLTYRCGDVAGYIAGSASEYTTATEIKWTPPIGLAHENPTGTSVQIVYTLYTYTAEGVHVGTKEKTITGTIPASVKPSCSITLTDPTGWMNTYGRPVQGVSKIKIKVDAQTSYSSPIASYAIDANGANYSDDEVTTNVLATSGTFKVNATVKDQRGRSGSATDSLDVLAYSKPQVTALDVHRCDEDGTENDQGEYVSVVFSAKVTNLSGKNPATYSLRYKESTASGFTEVQFSELDNVYSVIGKVYIFPADSNASYDVEVTATDNHGSTTRATSASTAFTLLNWHESGTGMGVGKVSEKENAVEFALDLYDKNGYEIRGWEDLIILFFNLYFPVGSIFMRYDNQNPNTLYPGTTWVQITARILRAGSAGSVGTEGSIADGSGRTYIDVAVWRRTA